MATAANSFRLTAAEIFAEQQKQQLRHAGILIKSYRDYNSGKKISMTQTDVATAAKTTQPIVSDLERGKTVPNDLVLEEILKVIHLPISCPEGKAVFENLKTIRDTIKDIKRLPKHRP